MANACARCAPNLGSRDQALSVRFECDQLADLAVASERTRCKLPVTFFTSIAPYTRHAGPSGTKCAVLPNCALPLACETILEAEMEFSAAAAYSMLLQI